jgi:lipoyl(octanoyl) transferase
MAVDEVVARACGEGWGLPTLRLYRWSVPTVSLGLNQPVASAVDLAACSRHGIGVVRRPTGGRALLHHSELTYSLALPIPPGSRSVLQDYRWISQCLLLGLQHLGVGAVVDRGRESRGDVEGLCFLSTSRYELTVGGRKLIGSAQRRFDGALLQHGSLLIDMDPLAWLAVFPQARDLGRRATALRALLGRLPTWEELVSALRSGFEEGAKVRLDPGGLTGRERAAVQELAQRRYGAGEWTLRR